MKFILNENKKFKLEERFILVEAEEEEDPVARLAPSNQSDTESDNTVWGSGWDDLYEACKKATNPQEAFNKFWEGGLPTTPEENPNNLPVVSKEEAKGYYEAAWGPNANFIKSLIPFVEETKKFGFTKEENPFIEYLTLVLPDKKLTKEAYTYIHNAYVYKIISIKDLRGTGTFLKDHLIFQPGFQILTLNGLSYLEAQKTIIDNEYNFKVSQPDIKNIIFNILSNDGNLDDLNSGYSGEILTLRPIRKVENIIEEYTKGTEKAPATTEEIESLINKYKKDAKKVLSYLATKYRSNSAAFKKLGDNLAKKIKNNKGQVITSFEEDEAYDKAFNKKFSDAQQLALFKGFAKEAGFIK